MALDGESTAMAAGEEISFDLSLHRPDFRFHAVGGLPLAGITAIFGPSGSGKTTFLRTVAGLEAAAVGHLNVAGKRFQDEDGTRLPPEARKIGYVFQDAVLFPHLNVKENLLYSYKRAPVHRRRCTLDEVVQLVRIEHLLRHEERSLSGGERQRVAIARALLSFPRLLLMDEPLASLDASAKRQLLSVIDLVVRTQKVPVFYVTHSPMELARLADRVLLFEQGSCQLASVGQILARQDLYAGGPQEVLSRLDVFAADFDEVHQLARYRFGDELLSIPARRPPSGAARLIIRASDLTLSLSAPRDSSVLNSIPVTICHLEHLEPATILVHCEASGGRLIASITSFAFKRLGIVLGTECVLQLKATALFSDDTRFSPV